MRASTKTLSGSLAAGRGSDQFMIRFPAGMREAVARRAAENGRSINTEVIAAVQKCLGHDTEKDRLRALIRDLLAEERAA